MKHKRGNVIVWLVVAGWAALVVVLSAFGLFATRPDKPPLPLLIAMIGPPALFGVAYRLSPNVRAAALGQDLILMTAMQGWRIIGGMFLVLMWFGLLPGTFAWPAGVGDVIVGAYAPFVTVAVARQAPRWRTHVVLLNVLGLLDFVGAIGGGVLSGRSPIGILHGDVTTDVMQQLPLSVIPTFGVPFWIILHVISLVKVRIAAPAGTKGAAA
jgi:hypothetical protein